MLESDTLKFPDKMYIPLVFRSLPPQARLALCELTSRMLKQGLHLLDIEVPERM